MVGPVPVTRGGAFFIHRVTVFPNDLGRFSMRTCLEDLFRLRVSDFVRAGCMDRPKRSGTIELPRPVGRVTGIAFRVDLVAMRLTLTATVVSGNQVVTEIGLIQRPTNLGVGKMWMFDCPITHTPCRVLYCIDGQFGSRSAIDRPRYRLQLQGRKGRFFSRYHRPSPARVNGKPTYRGKLTPYGKRVQRYNDTVEELDAKMFFFVARRFKLWKHNSMLEPLKDLDF